MVPGGGGGPRARPRREAAREEIYGMPYAEWKARHQTEATAEQQAKLAEHHAEHA